MDMTTLSAYKLFDARFNGNQPTATHQDAVIQDAITSISALVEQELGRAVQVAPMVSQFSALISTRAFSLKSTPITVFTSITIDGDDYTTKCAVDMTYGRVILHYPVKAKYPLSVIITYTGGMAADTPSFMTAYPGLVMEIHKQIKFELVRRPTLGQEVVGTGQERATLTRNVLIPSLMNAISKYRPTHLGL